MRGVAVSNSLAVSLETWCQREPFLSESFSVEPMVPPAIDTDANYSMIIFSNISPVRDAGVPIQVSGLAFAATG